MLFRSKDGAAVENSLQKDAAALVEKVSAEAAADAMPQTEIPAEETPAN